MIAPSTSAVSSHRPRRRLAALLLLGGRVRLKELSKISGTSLLDLPLDPQRTLLGQWVAEASQLCKSRNDDRLTVRVLLDQKSPIPTMPPIPDNISLSMEHDPLEFRGTAGVLHDSCAAYDDDDVVLVANAAQILFSSLTHLAACLESLDAGVAVASHADGTPVTLMLFRCATLRKLSPTGYVDMKEQALPAIGKDFTIKVAAFSEVICRGVRTRASYIEALQAVSGRSNADPLAERWRSDFQICDPAANIGPGVRLHNSVVMRGATIGRNAVLVRSIAFPGAFVPAGAVLMDKLASAEGIQVSEEAA